MESSPELDRAGLVVISHTERGDLIDFVVLKNLKDVAQLSVTPEKLGPKILVTLFGVLRAPELRKDISVGTSLPEGIGVVQIGIKDGLASGMFGNSVHTPSPISDKTLKSVSEQIAKGRSFLRQGGTIQVQPLIPAQGDAGDAAASVETDTGGSKKSGTESEGSNE